MSISPCIKICKLIDGICIGCNRTIEQITEWENYKDIEKENIIKHLKKTSSNSKRQL